MHAVGTLLAVSELAGRLEPAGEQLRALLPRACPYELRAAIQYCKPQLLELLRLDFIIVRSAALREVIFFAADEATKTALTATGAEPSCIYTRAELRELVEQDHRAGLTANDLLRIHAAKRIFNGRIAAHLQ